MELSVGQVFGVDFPFADSDGSKYRGGLTVAMNAGFVVLMMLTSFKRRPDNYVWIEIRRSHFENGPYGFLVPNTRQLDPVITGVCGHRFWTFARNGFDTSVNLGRVSGTLLENLIKRIAPLIEVNKDTNVTDFNIYSVQTQPHIVCSVVLPFGDRLLLPLEGRGVTGECLLFSSEDFEPVLAPREGSRPLYAHYRPLTLNPSSPMVHIHKSSVQKFKRTVRKVTRLRRGFIQYLLRNNARRAITQRIVTQRNAKR